MNSHPTEPSQANCHPRLSESKIRWVTLVYGFAASIWILFSDQLIAEMFGNQGALLIAGTLKGWGFVAVTALAFYLYLRSLRHATTHVVSGGASVVAWRAAFVVLFVLLITSGSYLILQLVEQHEAREKAKLQVIAQLKTRQLEGWLRERWRDAEELQHAKLLHQALRVGLRDGDVTQQALIVERLAVLKRFRNYESISLVNRQGHVILGDRQGDSLSGVLHQTMTSAFENRALQFTDLYKDGVAEDEHLHLDFVVPLPPVAGKADLALVLRLHHDDFLFPFLQDWPLPTQSAETLLFRREGNAVVFLNELRHRRDSALKLRIPLSERNILAVAFARGDFAQGTAYAATDYRGKAVMGVGYPVAGTAWMLLAKIDEEEFLAETRTDVFWAGSATVFAILLLLSGGVVWRQHRQLQTEQEMRREREEATYHLQLSEQRYRELFETQQLQTRRANVLLELPLLAESLSEVAFLKRSLEFVEDLTASEISFIHFVAEDAETIELVTWSRRTLEHYCRAGFSSHYPVGCAGLWADAVRERRPVVFNDYPACPTKRGLPEGHAPLQRLVVVPVLEHDKVVMIAGVGNRQSDYRDVDVETLRLITSDVWRIVQRRRAEAQLQKLSLAVEQSHESILITNLRAEIEYVNDAFVRVSGFQREELLGRNPRLLHSGNTPQEVHAGMWERLLRGETWRGEFHNRRKDGSDYVEQATITPLRAPDGQVTHYVAVKEDITEKKRDARELDQHRQHLEQLVEQRTHELNEAVARAEAANQAKSQFLANMSHEIRTPINAIIGLAYLLRRADCTPEQGVQLGKIANSGQHLLSIITNILDLSKIEAGHFVIDHQTFSLPVLFERVRSISDELGRTKGLSIELDCSDAPQWLIGDATRLRQALLNYVGNAVKFSAHGTILVRASVVARLDSGDIVLRFEVRDRGIGIPEDELARLFQPFEQVDASLTRRHGGTGLGLAITRHIAKLMGGEVGVESMLGQGSTFWFTACLKQGKEIATAVGEGAEVEGALRLRHNGARLLLVEDDDINQEIISALLQEVGLQITIASNGQEAVDLASQQEFDLILMDMQMPVMDGLSATRAIRALPRGAQVPILALTANAFGEDRRTCMVAGMNDFLPKPLSPATLYGSIAFWLDTRSNRKINDPFVWLAGRHGVDLVRGLEMALGSPEKYLVNLARFIEMRADNAARIRAFLAEGDWLSAREMAHSLAGVAAMMGFVSIADLARKIDGLMVDAGATGPDQTRRESLHADLDSLARELGELAEVQ